MIKSHPFVGVGLNTFEEVMPNYDNTGVSRNFQKPVHNYFLLVAAETGLCGLIFFVVLLIKTLWIGCRSITNANPDTVALQIGCTAALLSCTLANLVDVTMRKYTTGLLFWVILGLLGACCTSSSRMIARKKAF
jgi:O-antigen ligase